MNPRGVKRTEEVKEGEGRKAAAALKNDTNLDIGGEEREIRETSPSSLR